MAPRWLADIQPEVAAQCILESGAALADRETLPRELHHAWAPRLTDIESDPAPEARAAVGRAVGRLEIDDRRGVGLRADGLPDIDWVEIPGGELLYQDGEHRTCEGFRIARYPVTHTQFQAFLDAEDGYANHHWWRGLDEPVRNPEPARWTIANHPRETVSWQEAMAFCAWLTEHLGFADTGSMIRLPTEGEWERVARGTDGRAYPWGSEYESGRAKINETLLDAGPHYLGRTSPVGIYPRGASPEGVLDLSGNVWEWCLNEYANPLRTQPGGSGSRVVRGGSWLNDQGSAVQGPAFQCPVTSGWGTHTAPEIRFDGRLVVSAALQAGCEAISADPGIVAFRIVEEGTPLGDGDVVLSHPKGLDREAWPGFVVDQQGDLSALDVATKDVRQPVFGESDAGPRISTGEQVQPVAE